MLTYFTPGNREPGVSAVRPLAVTVSLALMLAVLWALMHHYQGFARDGELYAVQASARLNPALSTDVYLANTSQDRYSVFSLLYASLIGSLGLQHAALLLYVLCTAGFLAAAWALARELSSTDAAWLAVVMLISTTGFYGAYAIFHYSESYLTARSLAEALVVAALAAHFHGWRKLGLATAAVGLVVHPLMALPGLLLLICLWLPIPRAAMGAAAGLLATLAVALIAAHAPASAGLLTVMDPSWLDVVRERSHFLFLDSWAWRDWELQLRPFLCLTLSAIVIDDERVRRLCAGAMLVGGAGLAVAFIAGAVGPVAILLQGQAWRWFWVTGFASVLLLGPTALRMWRDDQCGPLCVILLVAGWTFEAVDGTALIALALLLWSSRRRIEGQAGRYLRWAGFALIAIIVVWVFATSWPLFTSVPVGKTQESLVVDRIRGVLGSKISAVLFFALFWHWIRSTRSPRTATVISVLLAASLTVILPGTFRQLATVGTPAEIAEFAQWRSNIPPASNVLVVPAKNSASFVWFTLGKPSYLSVDQSAGVVFSRATALEIRRRAQVLVPIMEPDFRIRSQMAQEARGIKLEDQTRPLTSQSLAQICGDPLLGFVVAKEQLGFDSLRQTHSGTWKDWNLYDCRRVRVVAPAA
jgi:hypothetical protein